MRKIVAKTFTLMVLLGLSVTGNGSPQNPPSHEPSVPAPANSTVETATVAHQTHHDSAIDSKGISTRSLDLDFYMPEIHVHEYADPEIGGNPLSTFAFEDFDDLNDGLSSENNTSPPEVKGAATSPKGTGSLSDQIVSKDRQAHVDNKSDEERVVARANNRNYSGMPVYSEASTQNQWSQNQTNTGQAVSNVSQSDIKKDQNVDGRRSDHGELQINGIGGKPLLTFKFEDSSESLPNNGNSSSSLTNGTSSRLTQFSQRSPNQSYDQSAGHFHSNNNQTMNRLRFEEPIPVIGGQPLSTFKFENLPSLPDSQHNTSVLQHIRNDNRLDQWSDSPNANRIQTPAGNLNTATLKPYGGYVSISRSPVYTFWFDDLRVLRPIVEQFATSPGSTGSSGKEIDGRAGTDTNERGHTPSFDDDRERDVSSGKERLPWQVSVFSKQETPYARVCGGSLVSNAAVVSAAHCFWRHAGLLPASQFAVGAGEILPYRLDDYNSYRQQNDVAAIKVPADFGGAAGSRSDIAVLLLARPLFNQRGLRPVCVSFDTGLEERQLVAGTLATTLGKGLLKEKGLSVLERLEVPYIAEEACSRTVDPEMLGHFTGDKICAGFKPGASPALGKICSIDAGAGLAFFLGSPRDVARGVGVPVLRGVASRLPASAVCGARGVTLYTRVREHRALLEEHVRGAAGECARYYPQAPSLVDEGGFVCNCYC